MGPDAQRRREAAALLAEVDRTLDQLGWHHAVADDGLIVVEVVNEQVERAHSLLQTGRDPVPFALRNHARDQIERHRAVDAGVFEIDPEGDAGDQRGHLAGRLALVKFVAVERFEVFPQRPRRRARAPGGGNQLVVERAGLVVLEIHAFYATGFGERCKSCRFSRDS